MARAALIRAQPSLWVALARRSRPQPVAEMVPHREAPMQERRAQHASPLQRLPDCNLLLGWWRAGRHR